MAEATASETSTGLTSRPAESAVQQQKPATSARRDYKGFVAGVFSGIAKLSGMFYICQI
jgi:solute carrier family 25 carnitine/acylcarnitine transporter 20/29